MCRNSSVFTSLQSFKEIIALPRHYSGGVVCVLSGMSLTQTLLSEADNRANKCWETNTYVIASVVCVCPVLTSIHVNADRHRKSYKLQTFLWRTHEIAILLSFLAKASIDMSRYQNIFNLRSRFRYTQGHRYWYHYFWDTEKGIMYNNGCKS